jgi:hypothetical protein
VIPGCVLGRRDLDLYLYAIDRVWTVLVARAALLGRGWYHFADGEVIVAAAVSEERALTPQLTS